MTALLTGLTLLFIGLTIYVYVGYGVVLWVVRRFHRVALPRSSTLPTVSLIIAAYNEADVIREKLENCRELDYPADKLEVMVVADGSSDNTADVARQFEGVIVLHTPVRRGKSAALNRGVAQATGEIIVFSDANAFYYPDAIRQLVRHFADPRVTCVSGRKTVRSSASAIAESEGLYWRYESFLKKYETQTGSTVGVVGEMNSLRAANYVAIPENIINDDSFLAWRALRDGYRVVYEPDAISWETSAASTADEIKRRQRINAGRYQQLFMPSLWWGMPAFNLFKLFSHKFFRLLLPFFMIGALLFNTLALLLPDVSGWLWLLWIGQMIAYGMAAVGFLAERSGRKQKLFSAAYYIVSSNAASLSGFFRYIRKQQSVLWEKAQRSQVEKS